MKATRRKSLISAAILEIGEAGTLEVTVGQIARRAGISPALAHHYFGSKDQIFLAAMRHVLETFRVEVVARLRAAEGPEARLRAVIEASFDESQFSPGIVAAWLSFYVRALRSAPTRRLLHVYGRRLHANLLFDLRQIFDLPTAHSVAHSLAAMIDGFYIRQALQEGVPDRAATAAIVNDHLDQCLERKERR